MRTFTQIEKQLSRVSDGHVHLFNHESTVPISHTKTIVGFEDIEFRSLDQYTNGQTLEHYDNYIANNNLDGIILCATGIDTKTIIDTHKKYPDIIRGFGELKCYAETKHGVKLPYNNLDWVETIVRYSSWLDHPLPVIIHYNIDDKSKIVELDGLLSNELYNNVPIVLCHCGMPGHEYDSNISDDNIFNIIVDLQKAHSNLWIDISYSGLDYIYNNPHKLPLLDPKRIYLGSDINPVIYRLGESDEYISDAYNKISSIYDKIDNSGNIFSLFLSGF